MCAHPALVQEVLVLAILLEVLDELILLLLLAHRARLWLLNWGNSKAATTHASVTHLLTYSRLRRQLHKLRKLPGLEGEGFGFE